jgi:hypothetical protein
LHIQRSRSIDVCAHRSAWLAFLLTQKPVTRAQFRRQIEIHLIETAMGFCGYLYAEANSKRAEAAWLLDGCKEQLEYELPQMLLCRVNRPLNREKLVKSLTPTLRNTMDDDKKTLERMFRKYSRRNAKYDPSCEAYRLKKALVQPEAGRFEEFFSWVDAVVAATLVAENKKDRFKATLELIQSSP